ncbi:MAG: hypothetical protein Q8O88_00960 [bacterium]|nr:hypothetical protein [bacterium]
MSDPYLTLFKKSKTLLSEVKLVEHVPSNDGATYMFTCKEYNVTITMTKMDETKSSIWKREFNCDCRASIRGSAELCSHALACLVFLVTK